ncbi:MAG TPA: hypothetical protein VES68_03050 [Candidatus Sulfotelmatobacter sp.]|nr:hypothetical protein [Candidatus Sulfotelmatobacter sp.]
MKIKKIILKILFLNLVILLGFIFVKHNIANASLCPGNVSPETYGYFNNYNSGTEWEVYAKYCRSGGSLTACPTSNSTSGNWGSAYVAYIWTNYNYPSGGTPYFGVWDLTGYIPKTGDALKWQSACVDPVAAVIASSNCTPDGRYYEFSRDVSCKNYPASNTVYGGCGYNSGVATGAYSAYAKNLGPISYNSACPICNNQSGTCACTSGGIHGSSCDIGCNGTCTDHYCSGTSCASKAYSTACGGAAISGTSMCSASSYTCSPPGPSVTLTTSCSSGKARISASYGAVSHGSGAYDLRWRVSGGSFTNVCSPTNPNAITNLADATTYEVQVRENTTAGYNGPTNFTSKSITTPTCTVTLPPPTCTLTANPTSIQTNGTSSLTASCTAGAGGGSISYSWPAPSIGTVGNVVTATNTYTAPSTAGTATVSVKGCQSTDGQCATATTNITVTSVPTYTISGNVFVDQDNSGAIKNAPPDTNYSGINVSAGSSGSNVSNSSGNYTISGLTAGTYSVSIPVPAGYSVPVRTQTITVGPSAANINFRLIPAAAEVIDVFKDYNGNGVDDGVAEPAYSGATITVTGTSAGTYTSANCSTQSANVLLCTTDSTGQAITGNLPAGSYTSNLTPIPSGYTLTTANNVSRSIPPSTTVNFGLHPAAPTCSGGLTANPTSVTPGQTSTLNAVGCSSPVGTTITYSWPAPNYGTTTDVNNPTTTWTAPNPWWTKVDAYPSVNVCITGTPICTPYTATITINPRFSVSGNVFVDQDKDQLQDNGDPNYSGAISISPNPAGVTVTYPSSGTYLISNMPGGTYTISYTSLPTGYQMTYPQNGPPASFTVTVGNASTGNTCNEVSNSATCDVNGNITTLSYGITNSLPWIQSQGGDITGTNVTNPSGGGISNPIPAGATCGTYVSLVGSGSPQTPGVVFSGASSYDFGSGQASQDPYNWVVGGNTYPDTYTPLTPGTIKTSYNYVSSIAKASGITPVDIASYCGANGINSCSLSANIPNGIYIANGDLTLTGASYTFPANKNYIILVSGTLNINTEIHVPVGSTVMFTSLGDINVGSNVGESNITLTTSNIEGYYSTDTNFNVLGTNTCPTSDLRLNVAGSIVVNASLTGGSFNNQRDLCAGDLQCPAFMIKERPDFILYAPDFFKTTRRVWREVAP